MIQINFTPEQYKTLVKLVYLGNWLANANNDAGNINEEFQELEKFVYAQAALAGISADTGLVPDDGEYFPSKELEDDLQQLVDEYEDSAFWDNLASRLAYRDLIEEFGERAVEEMGPERRVAALGRHEERYNQEFEEFGLDNLRLVKI